jgi:hypothetical protein
VASEGFEPPLHPLERWPHSLLPRDSAPFRAGSVSYDSLDCGELWGFCGAGLCFSPSLASAQGLEPPVESFLLDSDDGHDERVRRGAEAFVLRAGLSLGWVHGSNDRSSAIAAVYLSPMTSDARAHHSEPSDAAWKRSGVIGAAALLQLAYDRQDAADAAAELAATLAVTAHLRLGASRE